MYNEYKLSTVKDYQNTQQSLVSLFLRQDIAYLLSTASAKD